MRYNNKNGASFTKSNSVVKRDFWYYETYARRRTRTPARRIENDATRVSRSRRGTATTTTTCTRRARRDGRQMAYRPSCLPRVVVVIVVVRGPVIKKLDALCGDDRGRSSINSIISYHYSQEVCAFVTTTCCCSPQSS